MAASDSEISGQLLVKTINIGSNRAILLHCSEIFSLINADTSTSNIP